MRLAHQAGDESRGPKQVPEGDSALVELNAEGAFGVSYADRLTELFEGFQPMREFSRERRVTPMQAGNALVGAVLDTWHEFGGTRVLHLPMQSIIRVEEVERKGQSAIRDAATGEKVVTPFPMPAKPR